MKQQTPMAFPCDAGQDYDEEAPNTSCPTGKGRFIQRGFQPGMELRDYFAAKAMQGWLASFGEDAPFPEKVGVEDLAAKAYWLADAMLKARQNS